MRYFSSILLGVQGLVEKLKLTTIKVNRLSSSEDHDTLTGLKSLELKKVSNSSSNSDGKIWLDLRGMKNLERLKVFSARPETVLEPKVDKPAKTNICLFLSNAKNKLFPGL